MPRGVGVRVSSSSQRCQAEIAQLVEHNLAKVGVASSSLVFRSNEAQDAKASSLVFCPGGGMVDARVSGARAARRAGSIPVLGTKRIADNLLVISYFFFVVYTGYKQAKLLKIRLPVGLAVEGMLDAFDGFVEERNLVRLYTFLQKSSKILGLNGLTRLGDIKQFGCCAKYNVSGRNTDAILNAFERLGGILHLGRIHLVAPDVDDIVPSPLQVKHTLGINGTDVGCIDFPAHKNSGCRFGTSHIARHNGIAGANHPTVFRYANGRMLHRHAYNARLTAILAELVAAYDACLGRGVGVIKPGMRQKLAKLLHVILGDRCSTRLDEINLMADSRKFLPSQLQQHPDAGGNEERGKLGER